MSEIRSQATPARDELAEALQGELFERGQQVGEWPDDEKELHRDPDQWTDFTDRANKVRKLRFEKAADALLTAGWSKPRTVNSATELKALPKCSLIRGLEREGQRSGDVFEKVGPDHWLCLDPGDRFDGEETTPSHAIILIYKAGIRVLFTPGDAG